MLVVAFGQLVGLAVPPGEHGPLGGVLVSGLVGQLQVEVDALEGAFRQDGNGVVADHAGDVAVQPGEPGEPAALLVHPQVGFDGVPMGLGLQDQLEGMHAAIGVPDAVVAVVAEAAVFVDLAVEATVEAVHAVVMHPGGGAVDSGIEDPELRLGAAFHTDLAQNRIPSCLALALDLLEGQVQEGLPGTVCTHGGDGEGYAYGAAGHLQTGGSGRLFLVGVMAVRQLRVEELDAFCFHLQTGGHGAHELLGAFRQQEAIFIPEHGAVLHENGQEGRPLGVAEAEHAPVAAGGMGLQDAAVLQKDLVEVGLRGLQVMVEEAGALHVAQRRGAGHQDGMAGGEAEDLVGEVAVLHAGPEHGLHQGRAVGRLDRGSGGLEQMADGADIGVYILGKVSGMHKIPRFPVIMI